MSKQRLSKLESLVFQSDHQRMLKCYQRLIDAGLATAHEVAFVERGGFAEGMGGVWDEVDVWGGAYKPLTPDSPEYAEEVRLYNLRKPIFDEFNLTLEKPEYDPWQSEQSY